MIRKHGVSQSVLRRNGTKVLTISRLHAMPIVGYHILKVTMRIITTIITTTTIMTIITTIMTTTTMKNPVLGNLFFQMRFLLIPLKDPRTKAGWHRTELGPAKFRNLGSENFSNLEPDQGRRSVAP